MITISDETLAKNLYWPKGEEKAMPNNQEKDDQIQFIIDEDLKKRFKMFCIVKETTQKEYLTTCIEAAVRTLEKKRS